MKGTRGNRTARGANRSDAAAALLASTIVLLASALAHAEPPATDASLCRKAKSVSAAVGGPALLVDRYGSLRADAAKISGVCTPAGPSVTPDVHRVRHKASATKSPPQAAFQPRTIRTLDRFGSHLLVLQKPVEVLASSALAPGEGGAPAVDTSAEPHVLCYKAVPSREDPDLVLPAPFAVTDRFGTATVTLRKIAKVCVPASIDGIDADAPFGRIQQVCYLARAEKGEPEPGTVSTANVPFGSAVLRVAKVAEFCVPAWAEAPAPSQAGQTWGDCRRKATNEDGSVVDLPDDGDLPADTSDCVESSCDNGTPFSSNAGTDRACDEGGGRSCDGNGTCAAPTVPGCSPEYVGDGFCDAACNVADAAFDGGDCCAGTCTAGRPYPCGSNGYACTGARRQCLFLHGVGNTGDNSFRAAPPVLEIAGSSQPYWGDMSALLYDRCTVLYANHDTTTRGWDDTSLQDSYYNEALSVFTAGGVVFAHGMANSVLAGACLQQGKCSVRWISLGGALRGSQAAATDGALDPVYGAAASSAAAASMAPDYLPAGFVTPPLSGGQLQATVMSRGLVRAAICGVDSWGGGGTAGAALVASRAASSSSFGCSLVDPADPTTCYRWDATKSDGVVSLDECSGVSASGSMSSSPASPFFAAAANHFDLAGKGSDRAGVLTWIRAMESIF